MEEKIAKYWSNNMSAAERMEFERQLQADPVLREETVRMRNVEALLGLAARPGDKFRTRSAFDEFNLRLQERRHHHRRAAWLKYAAVVAVAVVGTWLLAVENLKTTAQPQFTEICVPEGQRVNITLADGSKVCLSPLSKMRFASDFPTGKRVVELDGGGYFSVARDTEHPFVIRTEDYNIKVLGTEFNVFAYSRQKEKFETCLVKGKVLVYNNRDQSEQICLDPDERAVIEGDRIAKKKSEYDYSRYVQKGVFGFRNKSLREILDYLSVWHNINFVIEDGVDADRQISGKFRQSSEVFVVLDVLRSICDFNYRKIDDNNYIIYH